MITQASVFLVRGNCFMKKLSGEARRAGLQTETWDGPDWTPTCARLALDVHMCGCQLPKCNKYGASAVSARLLSCKPAI